MKEILTKPIGSISIDEERSLLTVKFNERSNINEYKYFRYVEEMLIEYAKYVKQYKIEKVIIDMNDVDVLVDEEFTEWIGKNITPLVADAGLKKLAFILPKNALIKLDLEYIIAPILKKHGGPERRIFNTYQEALDWLLEA